MSTWRRSIVGGRAVQQCRSITTLSTPRVTREEVQPARLDPARGAGAALAAEAREKTAVDAHTPALLLEALDRDDMCPDGERRTSGEDHGPSLTKSVGRRASIPALRGGRDLASPPLAAKPNEGDPPQPGGDASQWRGAGGSVSTWPAARDSANSARHALHVTPVPCLVEPLRPGAPQAMRRASTSYQCTRRSCVCSMAASVHPAGERRRSGRRAV